MVEELIPLHFVVVAYLCVIRSTYLEKVLPYLCDVAAPMSAAATPYDAQAITPS